MPLPVAHSLAGLAVYGALDADGEIRPKPRALLAVAASNAPDLDFIPGLIIGDPNRFHHGPTHSFVTAVVVAVAFAWLAVRSGWHWPVAGRWRRELVTTAVMLALLFGSHVALDMVTDDPSPPHGVPALWPMSGERMTLGPLFLRADKLPGQATPVQFAASVLSLHNLEAALRELAMLGPLVVAVRLWRSRRGSRGG